MYVVLEYYDDKLQQLILGSVDSNTCVPRSTISGIFFKLHEQLPPLDLIDCVGTITGYLIIICI